MLSKRLLSLPRTTSTVSNYTIGRVVQSRYKSSTISALQAAFRDPTSPFHIPPGTQGPASPDDYTLQTSQHADLSTATLSEPSTSIHLLASARAKLISEGLDPASFWEQQVVWGDHDSFQHVNNVKYVRYFESARIKWMTSIGNELGGPEKSQAMLNGQGISFILKSIKVQFRRPVTFPDSLLIGYRPLPHPSYSSSVSDSQRPIDNSTFQVTSSIFSLAQQAFVAHSTEELVWYDYDQLKKCDPGQRARDIVHGRTRGN